MRYICRFWSHSIIVKRLSSAGCAIEPHAQLLDEFKNGEIGFRYIIKYTVAWFNYKLHH